VIGMRRNFPGTKRLQEKCIEDRAARCAPLSLPFTLGKAIAACLLCLFATPLLTLTNLSARKPPIATHWFYCVETETQKQKDTYFSSTFESSADQKDLLHDFSASISKEYDVSADRLMGLCYAVRRYKPDNFANVEEQRSQHMEQSHKQGQNVIATGWAPK
jgi:hypothetical protein